MDIFGGSLLYPSQCSLGPQGEFHMQIYSLHPKVLNILNPLYLFVVPKLTLIAPVPKYQISLTTSYKPALGEALDGKIW